MPWSVGSVTCTIGALVQAVKHLEMYVTQSQVQQGMLDNLSRAYELEALRSEDRRQKLQRQLKGT